MEEFYKQWLNRFAENRQRFLVNQRNEQFIQQEGGDEQEQDEVPQHPSEIVYENDSLKLIVEKSSFKRQKNFRLQDHLFKFKVQHKEVRKELPLLSELFDFLHAALLHVLESVKTFYKKKITTSHI